MSILLHDCALVVLVFHSLTRKTPINKYSGACDLVMLQNPGESADICLEEAILAA